MFLNKSGLSAEEVKIRQQQYGFNILPEKPIPSNLFLIIRQLKNPLIYVLLLADLVTLIIGHFPDAAIIFFAIVINTILGFFQEKKAANALHALKHYIVNFVTVIRENKRTTVKTLEIVPGDIVILNQGTKVPADGQLIHVNRLYIDESLLTGESLPVKKTHDSAVFMGTTIASGQAIMLVEKIGKETRMGKIALQIQESETLTPLQKQLKDFSKQLVLIISALVAFVFLTGIFYQFSIMDMFTTSVALAVSSIPEGLIVSMTVVLAIGMQKILKQRGLVRKLAAAETLGGVTVICIDKTGTLTRGKMSVVDAIGDKQDLAQQVILANDQDDPIVISAFEWGKKIISDLIPGHHRLDSIPFSSKEKFFCSLHQWSDKSNRLYVNGAPELLLKWTTLSDNSKKDVISTIDKLTKEGKRLIGFARKDVSVNKKEIETSDAKSGLSWVGMLAFTDPVRVGVKETLERASGAGIRTIVITGDYAKTSEFVLSQLGVTLSSNQIITGEELETLSFEDFSKKIKEIRLFARTTPDQKLAIVEALKKNGEIVAMMGDGVNDAPALHRSDIGISVGEATDVAKESSDLILLDSDFSTIIKAIEEGRSMFENIRKIILYLMCDAFVEIIVILGGIILGLPLTITAIQILWINIISDGFPGLALTIDPKRKDIMKGRSQLAGERLVNKWMGSLIGFVSLIAGLITLTSFFIVYKTTHNLILARSMAFVILGLNSLSYVFSVRTLMVPFWKKNLTKNYWLFLAVFVGFGLQILPFATPSLRQFFGLDNLYPVYWFYAIGLSVFMFFVVEIFKFFYHFKVIKNNLRLIL